MIIVDLILLRLFEIFEYILRCLYMRVPSFINVKIILRQQSGAIDINSVLINKKHR